MAFPVAQGGAPELWKIENTLESRSKLQDTCPESGFILNVWLCSSSCSPAKPAKLSIAIATDKTFPSHVKASLLSKPTARRMTTSKSRSGLRSVAITSCWESVTQTLANAVIALSTPSKTAIPMIGWLSSHARLGNDLQAHDRLAKQLSSDFFLVTSVGSCAWFASNEINFRCGGKLTNPSLAKPKRMVDFANIQDCMSWKRPNIAWVFHGDQGVCSLPKLAQMCLMFFRWAFVSQRCHSSRQTLVGVADSFLQGLSDKGWPI